jgi:hypothetical protein
MLELQPDVQWGKDVAYEEAIDAEVDLKITTEPIEYLEGLVSYQVWDEIVLALECNPIELDISTELIECLDDMVDYKLWRKIVSALERVAEEELETNGY